MADEVYNGHKKDKEENIWLTIIKPVRPSARQVTPASQKEISGLLNSVRKLFTHFTKNPNYFPEGIVNYITTKTPLSQTKFEPIFFLILINVKFSLGFYSKPLPIISEIAQKPTNRAQT